MKKLTALICAINCLVLCSCSGGSIYSNYREVEQLMMIQAMGFDRCDGGVELSVSSGTGGLAGQGESEGGGQIVRMSAAAETLLTAQELIQDYSASEELFFAHTSYIVIGSDALSDGLEYYLDYIERNETFRLDIPVFAASGGSAKELVVGTGSDSYDAVNVLRSIERNLRVRGDGHLYTAGEIAADLNVNGSALICAVKTVPVGDTIKDASESEQTAVFDGYAVIGGGRAIAQLNAHDALAVNLLLNRSGPSMIAVEAEDITATLQLDDSSCDITPIFDGDELCGLNVSLKVSAALSEYRGEPDIKELNRAFERDLRSRLDAALTLSRETGCDFMQLGALLQKQQPLTMSGMDTELQRLLPNLYIYINVETEIDRGFVLNRPEVGK